MTIVSFEGQHPRVDASAWVASTAVLIGDVTVEADASVWYGAVLRGDLGPILIRAGANVQDGSVLHGQAGRATEIGAGATVGHGCVVHGAAVGSQALVGNGAVVQDEARIGEKALVAAGSTVAPGTVIPAESVAMGTPAKVRGPVEGQSRQWVDNNAAAYQELARRHRDGARVVA